VHGVEARERGRERKRKSSCVDVLKPKSRVPVMKIVLGIMTMDLWVVVGKNFTQYSVLLLIVIKVGILLQVFS
jgi:hypothetical protein